jgi:glycogen operon protein
VVINPYFDWGIDRPPRRPYYETVIYEAHVRGLTMRNPEVPEELRGTYAGLMHPSVIDHLHRIGMTAVELMPVQYYLDDHHLVTRGQCNYWGYNTIGFSPPTPGMPRGDRPASRSKSSRPWSRRCTRPASR